MNIGVLIVAGIEMPRTVREAIDAPEKMNELESLFWEKMLEAKLTNGECVALMEGIKKDAMRKW